MFRCKRIRTCLSFTGLTFWWKYKMKSVLSAAEISRAKLHHQPRQVAKSQISFIISDWNRPQKRLECENIVITISILRILDFPSPYCESGKWLELFCGFCFQIQHALLDRTFDTHSCQSNFKCKRKHSDFESLFLNAFPEGGLIRHQ